MIEKARAIEDQIKKFKSTDRASLEDFRSKYISKKGVIARLFADLKKISPEEKRNLGIILNELKQLAEAKFKELNSGVENSTGAEIPEIDLTLPPIANKIGHLHPLSLTRYRIIEIFERL